MSRRSFMPPTGSSSGAEHALEDRVDMLGVVAEVEHGLERLGWHFRGDFRIALELGQEVLAFLPRLHRVTLHETVAVLAADTGLGQREKHALGIVQAAE